MSAGRDMWSRRRDAVKAEEEAYEQAQVAATVAQERAALEEKTDAEILAELDLRDPQEMGEGDDFSAFMKAKVPDRLRRRALRKLWLSNPLLASVDELVEYGEDFTDASTVIENLQTAYQVGAGMLKHVREMEKEKAETEITALDGDQTPEQKVELPSQGPAMHADDSGDGSADDDGEILEAVISEDETVAVVAHDVSPALPVQDLEPVGVVKRKMRFEFVD